MPVNMLRHPSHFSSHIRLAHWSNGFLLRLAALCSAFALLLLFFVTLKSIADRRYKPKYGHLSSSAYDPELFAAFGNEAGDEPDEEDDLTVFDASQYKRLSNAGRTPLLG
jgi:hypothetical protein